MIRLFSELGIKSDFLLYHQTRMMGSIILEEVVIETPPRETCINLSPVDQNGTVCKNIVLEKRQESSNMLDTFR